jgi:cell division protease FtsH
MRWGMSDLMGPRVYGDNQSEVFLGRDVMTHKNMSNNVAEAVDMEIRRIIDEQYARARKIIENNRDKVELMAKSLIEWETLDAEQLDDIMSGNRPRPPVDLNPPSASGGAGPDKAESKPPITPSDKPAAQH